MVDLMEILDHVDDLLGISLRFCEHDDFLSAVKTIREVLNFLNSKTNYAIISNSGYSEEIFSLRSLIQAIDHKTLNNTDELFLQLDYYKKSIVIIKNKVKSDLKLKRA